jgi:hypothetical protein
MGEEEGKRVAGKNPETLDKHGEIGNRYVYRGI